MLGEHLPEARVLEKPEDAQGEEIEAVILNSDSYRRRHEATRNYLAADRDEFKLSYTTSKKIRGRFGFKFSEDDIEVYIRKPDG